MKNTHQKKDKRNAPIIIEVQQGGRIHIQTIIMMCRRSKRHDKQSSRCNDKKKWMSE